MARNRYKANKYLATFAAVLVRLGFPKHFISADLAGFANVTAIVFPFDIGVICHAHS